MNRRQLTDLASDTPCIGTISVNWLSEIVSAVLLLGLQPRDFPRSNTPHHSTPLLGANAMTSKPDMAVRRKSQNRKHRRHLIFNIVAMLFLLAGTSITASAQFDSATVLGSIKDPSAASVSSATVELKSVAKGVSVTRQTDASGNFEF